MKDNLDFFREHEEEQEKKLQQLPRCSVCKEPIQDDYYFEIDDEILCEECLRDNFRKNTDDYVRY